MDILMLTYGILAAAKDKYGVPYSDWRSAYLGRPGMIIVRRSEDEPEKKAVWLYPYAPDEKEQPYFNTSFGNITGTDEKIIIKTANSIYEFMTDDACLGEDEKSSLFYGICDILEPDKNIFGAEEDNNEYFKQYF